MPNRPHHPDTVITDPAQVHAWDAATIKAQGITSVELMARAVDAFVERFVVDFPLGQFGRVDVLVGPGNNGGDGAGIAGELGLLGYTVRAYRFGESPGTPDLRQMWQMLEEHGNANIYRNEAYPSDSSAQVVVDGLLGVGTSRALGGAFAKTVETVNAMAVPVVSVDVPSGQSIDGRHPEWPCVRATRTYTFGAIKYSALLWDTGPAWGEVAVLDIGLCAAGEVPALADAMSPRLITRDNLGAFLRPRPRFTHKGTWGHVLVVAGSRGHAGAALLAGRGAYRAGAGLVTFYVPEALEAYMQTGLPEAMTLTDPRADCLSAVPDLARYDAIVVGPGIGRAPETAAFLRELFGMIDTQPTVVDADALNLLAADGGLSAKLPQRAVLTPHPGEFARLVNRTTAGHERASAAQAYVASLQRPEAVLVLKDQCTVLAEAATPPLVNYYHGNPGMGSGGMGDVLSGVIGAQLARGLSTWDAARLGVYLHAAAGDLAAAEFGERALLAGDLAQYLGRV